MLRDKQEEKSLKTMFVSVLVVAMSCATFSSCEEDPTDQIISPVVQTTVNAGTDIPDTTLVFKEPPIPNAGGQGLPTTLDSGNEPTDEVDCDNAEELCDSGEWACDDIADYCDIGPDGGELPDDWDWDS